MGSAAGKAAPLKVELIVSELGGVPGCKAYHSSVHVHGIEYYFAMDAGIASSNNLESHEGRSVQRIDMGTTTTPVSAIKDQLEPHFRCGSYDLLKKNCNSFSDAALMLLVGKRLDKKYKQLEKFGARYPQLVARLSRGEYSPNPEAESFDLERVCEDVRFGPSWSNKGGRTVQGDRASASSAPTATSNKSSKAKAGKALPELTRVLILPFKDTFELNFDHMFQNYVLPYINSPDIADPSTGRGLHVGDEFAAKHGQVRFRVVSCAPAAGGRPSSNTVVLCEGDPIDRRVLKAVTILPLDSAMPSLTGKKPADIASEFVTPFLEQHSADLNPGQLLTICGLRFKVVATTPSTGGGACFATELCTTGPPVKTCTVEGCEVAIAKQCREKECKRWVCLSHAAEIVETSCLCPTHAPKKKRLMGLLKTS